MGSQVREETAVIDNANRMYTEEEDQKILAKWWNKKLRPELARELGRTEAALAQRFYAILKKKGIDPKTYREKMREQNSRYLQSVTPASGRSWTRDEDIILWRSVKAGEDFVDIAARLPGRTIDECRERYEVLRQANAAADTSGQASEAFRPEVPQTAEAEDERKQEIQKSAEDGQAAGARIDIHDKDSEDAGDFLEVLRQFPQQAETLSHRMNDIERDIEYIKGSLQFTLEHLAKGLQNIANYLVGQEQDFTAFEKIRQENQALRTQLAALKQRMENEKKELRKVYNELEFWLGEFLEMRKIEKVANLGELIPKLKYSYDKFGVLLQIEKEA